MELLEIEKKKLIKFIPVNYDHKKYMQMQSSLSWDIQNGWHFLNNDF